MSAKRTSSKVGGVPHPCGKNGSIGGMGSSHQKIGKSLQWVCKPPLLGWWGSSKLSRNSESFFLPQHRVRKKKHIYRKLNVQNTCGPCLKIQDRPINPVWQEFSAYHPVHVQGGRSQKYETHCIRCSTCLYVGNIKGRFNSKGNFIRWLPLEFFAPFPTLDPRRNMKHGSRNTTWENPAFWDLIDNSPVNGWPNKNPLRVDDNTRLLLPVRVSEVSSCPPKVQNALGIISHQAKNPSEATSIHQ